MNDLIKGIGVIIDDQIFGIKKTDDESKKKSNVKDKIIAIKEKIEESGIPLVLYNKLPSEETLAHFTNVSFFIVDWNLAPTKIPNEVSVGSTLANENEEVLLSFLAKIKENYLAPVFIFSNENTESIKEKLKVKGLWIDNSKMNFIFVRGKTRFNLVKSIENWILKSPSLYVLTQWRKYVSSHQAKMLSDLHSASPHWASLLWKGYEIDGDSPKNALADLLIRNLRTRLDELIIDAKHINRIRFQKSAKQDALSVHEKAFHVPNSALDNTKSGCGDVFKKMNGKKIKYKINIRCDCDCIGHDNEEPELYLISGTAFNPQKKEKPYDTKFGVVQIRNKFHYLFPIDDGKWIKFDFNKLEQKKPSELKNDGFSRVCRLTTPHLTDIRQRFAQWLQREGYPKIPTIPQ